MKRILVASAIAALAGFAATAPVPATVVQSAQVCGRIADTNGAALANAAVVLRAGSRSVAFARANGDGDYCAAIAAGSYRLVVSAAGYRTGSMDFAVGESGTRRANMTLDVSADADMIVM